MNLWYAACPRLPRGAYGAIAFEPLDNGVLAVPIRKRPQQICDAQTGDKINALLRKGLRLLPDRCPVTATILDVPSRILLDSSAKIACIYGLPQGSFAKTIT